MLAFGGGLLAGLFATPLAVHHLGPSRWGDYTKVVSLLSIVAALTEGGLGQLGLRETSAMAGVDRSRFLRDLLGLRIALTLLGILLAVSFAALSGWDAAVVSGVALAGLGYLLVNVQGTYAIVLNADLRLGWLAIGDFAPQLASAAVMVLLALEGAALLPFYAAPLAAGVATCAVTACAVRSDISLSPHVNFLVWRHMLTRTAVYAVATAAGASYFRVTMVATSLLTSPRETGYFALPFRILELAVTVPWLFVGSTAPILFRAATTDQRRLRYTMQRLADASVALGGACSITLFGAAPVIISFLGGHRFLASTAILRILALALLASFPLAVFSVVLLALQLHRHLLVINLLVVLLAFALAPVLIPPFGAEGAAFMTLALEVVLCAAYGGTLLFLRRDLFSNGARLATAVGGLVLTLTVVFLLRASPLFATALGAVMFLALVATLRTRPRDLGRLLAGDN